MRSSQFAHWRQTGEPTQTQTQTHTTTPAAGLTSTQGPAMMAAEGRGEMPVGGYRFTDGRSGADESTTNRAGVLWMA